MQVGEESRHVWHELLFGREAAERDRIRAHVSAADVLDGVLHERRVEQLLDLRDRAAVENILKVEGRRVAFDERRRSLFCLRRVERDEICGVFAERQRHKGCKLLGRVHCRCARRGHSLDTVVSHRSLQPLIGCRLGPATLDTVVSHRSLQPLIGCRLGPAMWKSTGAPRGRATTFSQTQIRKPPRPTTTCMQKHAAGRAFPI